MLEISLGIATVLLVFQCARMGNILVFNLEGSKQISYVFLVCDAVLFCGLVYLSYRGIIIGIVKEVSFFIMMKVIGTCLFFNIIMLVPIIFERKVLKGTV